MLHGDLWQLGFRESFFSNTVSVAAGRLQNGFYDDITKTDLKAGLDTPVLVKSQTFGSTIADIYRRRACLHSYVA
ncbi:hypothetical protein F2Q70_00015633 [Brassica cretica]|uniref:Uncharacterized protein n=1 Tax=Brassica cretica TaxID=69181 RepID=A0A3N6RRD9_BRACR|nr:hypothetical protein F2Q70_00015633 [Brassica cretica]